MGISITLQEVFNSFSHFAAGFLILVTFIKGIEYLFNTGSQAKSRQREKDKRLEGLDKLAQNSDDIINSLNALQNIKETINDINVELIEVKADARKTKERLERAERNNAIQDQRIAESMLDRQRLIKNDIAILTALQKLGANDETEKAIRDTHEYLIKRLSGGGDSDEEE